MPRLLLPLLLLVAACDLGTTVPAKRKDPAPVSDAKFLRAQLEIRQAQPEEVAGRRGHGYLHRGRRAQPGTDGHVSGKHQVQAG